MEDQREQERICPFMSGFPVPASAVGHVVQGATNNVAVPTIVPCLKGQCQVAWVHPDNGEFLGCAVGIGPEVDKIQAHTKEIAQNGYKL